MANLQNVFLLGISVVILILIISRFTQTEYLDASSKSDTIKRLTRQAFRWYIASTQDSNPIIKGLHADYAVAYADILKQTASRDEILQITNLDIDKFIQAASDQQDEYIIEIARKCPDLIPKDPQYQAYIHKFLK